MIYDEITIVIKLKNAKKKCLVAKACTSGAIGSLSHEIIP
jgi:hypothetical protein